MADNLTANLGSAYDEAFFAAQVEGSARSAAVMVPHILKLLPNTSSVVDLGCGTGVWLHHFKLNGIPKVRGFDGGSAEGALMMLDHREFSRINLVQQLELGERFDLALSIETAEHLPPSTASTFVANLCGLADAVVFGAAIPGQGGTWHINERWASYWAALFDVEGYDAFDVLRPRVWYDSRVEWWYAQNTMLFIKRGRKDLIEQVRAAAASTGRPMLDIVHPRCFEAHRQALEAHRLQAQHAASVQAQPGEQVAAPVAETSRSSVTALEAAELRARAAERRLEEIEHSTSWRVTGPLRRFVEPFPGGRAALRAGLRPFWRMGRAAYHRLGKKG